MFKKLKDKLAEEVKSSPQRIQQFAQAAQAAVTSASSSISDITNSDLFSIGDNDSQQSRSSKSQSTSSQQNTFQDVALVQPLQSTSDSTEYMSSHDILENQRQRRLSNSSFASDVSFRLPSYETPSMYHLQSDMEVSASEAEERGFSSGTVSLDRVTKEQLYAAYRRTQERYTKYRTQYGDLARHYKLLERENAKARSVLVETQDKALRRISELREQCTLEQSAKAHLEKALRMDIEEKNMKIETLNTKVQLLQTNPEITNNDANSDDLNKNVEVLANDVQLINLSNDNEVKPPSAESLAEITALNNKIEKMEQLLNKYKESLKTSKEKNSQVTTELQIISNELEIKNKDIENLQNIAHDLAKAKDKIQDLSNFNEELQNKINVYEFTKTREQSTLEVDLQKAQEEIAELRGKIEVFSKREEDYAISLAENKLSIHKELESKEAEIKSLKDNLDKTKKEIQSLNIVVHDYKNNVSLLEVEKLKLNNECSDLALSKTKISELETQIEDLSKKCQNLEQAKTKADEEYKCLQLQLKQETAEKLAMIDRNMYLENRNTQLSDENTKKSLQIKGLENDLQRKERDLEANVTEDSKKDEILCELGVWKDKYVKLELEIQEERDELIKLQSEIEKLLTNHELLQTQNFEFRKVISDLESDNGNLEKKVNKYIEIEGNYVKLVNEVKDIRKLVDVIGNDAKTLRTINNESFVQLTTEISNSLTNRTQSEINFNENKHNELKIENSRLAIALKDYIDKHDTIAKQLIILQDDNNKLQTTINELKLDKEILIEKHDTIAKQLIILQDDNNKLQTTINELQLDKEILNQKVKSISGQHESSLLELSLLKEQHENLKLSTHEFESKIQNLHITTESEKNKYMNAVEKLNFIENEKQFLEEKYREIHNKNTLAADELEKVKTDHTNIIEELDILKKENNSLTEELDNRNNEINKLQEEVQTLNYENISLKGQAESIATSFKNMEVEINELRKSHIEIETEKDHLNEVIDKLESNSKSTSVKSIQTDDSLQSISIAQDVGCALEPLLFKEDDASQDQKVHEVNKVLETNNKIQSMQIEIDKYIQNNNELLESYNILKTDQDLLKEENRRYMSDIEGLQNYLTKISKENSVLNDKLRESIATSEHSTENNDVSSDLAELKSEIQKEKDKIDDLLRENSLLVEENLELKDQLQSQNYPKPEVKLVSGNDKEIGGMKEKYNNLLQLNSSLETRLIDLEQMNKSVNVNMVQMQEKNEKLRLSNEKLERRLDEALVSLRHLHSLQENTELEYLRNILYEYLTGSGTHSVTLAKVLSAIVKFDDMQTKLVLQKEKERQGILRQLGLI